MKVYFLSGLGADETVFQFLNLPGCQPVFLAWIKPEKNENLADYAIRIKIFYHLPADAVLTGLSFGGMLATEIAKAFPAMQVILISSAKTKYELPGFYRAGKYIPIHKWGSDMAQRWFMLHSKWLFGLRNERHEAIYETLIKNSDTDFNKWAVTALLNWQNTQVPSNIKHIHGTYDKIIPYRNVTCHETIEKGEHLMVMEHAATVSAFILRVIEERIVNPAVL